MWAIEMMTCEQLRTFSGIFFFGKHNDFARVSTVNGSLRYTNHVKCSCLQKLFMLDYVTCFNYFYYCSTLN